jgi:ABC-type iron transport system FetAB ATPase subunit
MASTTDKESVHIIKYTVAPGNTIKIWFNSNSKPDTIQRQVVSFMPPVAVPTWKGHPLPTEQEAVWVL